MEFHYYGVSSSIFKLWETRFNLCHLLFFPLFSTCREPSSSAAPLILHPPGTRCACGCAKQASFSLRLPFKVGERHANFNSRAVLRRSSVFACKNPRCPVREKIFNVQGGPHPPVRGNFPRTLPVRADTFLRDRLESIGLRPGCAHAFRRA